MSDFDAENISASKDVTVGRNVRVRGNSVFGHNVRVDGWLDAPNIRGAFKGLYADEATLCEAYPKPQPGWYALVGDTLPAAVYRVDGDKWVATGEQGGEFKVDYTYLQEHVDGITEQLKQLMQLLSGGSDIVGSELFSRFLRRDISDSTKYLLKLLGGVEVGDFIRSMTAGKGAGIDSEGNAQVESLEVRGYAKFMELIINRLTAMEGDYTFSESGTIEAMECVAEGTYVLTMRKRWDYDFTAFAENDVLYGTVNTLAADGDYYTSWMIVRAVNQAANTITVVLYGDAEVPAGKNFTPSVGMNLTRRGNALNEERQSCWYISTAEGVIMYLEGVTKPILEESNYYLSLGRPKHLSLFNGMQINYKHPYLFARGIIVQDIFRVDYQGNPIYQIVDKGLWDSITQYRKGFDEEVQAYVQHQVWWGSCCWRCLVAEATIGREPRWNNTEWVCVAGDSSYSLEIASSAGNFLRAGKEYTTLTATLRHGTIDISADAWQVAWTRESGDDAEDKIWATEHAGTGLVLDLKPADMPTNWYTVRKVTFRCTVSLLDGDDPSKLKTVSEVFGIS